jgi:hypothetical protein
MLHALGYAIAVTALVNAGLFVANRILEVLS